MKVRISVVVDTRDVFMTTEENLLSANKEELEHLLPYLFADAFGEFRAVRHVGHEVGYVRERYSIRKGYGWLDRDKKAVSTRRRNIVAELLRRAALQNVTIEEVAEAKE